MIVKFAAHLRHNVVSYLALFVALGGTSYAAVKLPANSVTSKQIKKGAVASSDLRANAVTSAKVKDGSLLRKDFKAGELPSGGAKGEAGAAGAPGTSCAPGAKGEAGPKGDAGAAGGTGAPGAKGDTGSAGGKGDTGPRGPSDGFVAADGPAALVSTTFATQRSLALGAGSYVVTATATLNNGDIGAVTAACQLLLGGMAIDSALSVTLAPDTQGGETQAVALTGAGSLSSAGAAQLQCRSTQMTTVSSPSIVATQVASLTTPAP